MTMLETKSLSKNRSYKEKQIFTTKKNPTNWMRTLWMGSTGEWIGELQNKKWKLHNQDQREIDVFSTNIGPLSDRKTTITKKKSNTFFQK